MSKNTENYKLYTFTSDNDVADLKLLEPTFDTIDKGLVLDVGESTGSGNNYILNLGSITLTSANKGISFKFWSDKNASGAVKINGTYNLVKPNGSSVTNLKKGAPYTVTYDGGTNFFLASGGGADTVTFTSDKLLTGYSANDSNGEKVNGTMVNLSESSPIQYDSSNPTKVVKADAVFQQKNTDNVERLLFRYAGNGGYIANNTLLGLPIADVAKGINLTADKLLAGTTILGVKGGIPNKGAVTVTLNASGSYTIPAGYHNGSGKVTATVESLGGIKYTHKFVFTKTTPSGTAQTFNMGNILDDMFAKPIIMFTENHAYGMYEDFYRATNGLGSSESGFRDMFDGSSSKEKIIANTDKSVQFKFYTNQNPGTKRIICVLEKSHISDF